jgi:hypothetical protein
MSPNSYYGYPVPIDSSGYWTRPRWFTFVVCLFVLWVAVYFFVHAPFGFTGYQYTKLTASQVQQIGSILRHNDQSIFTPPTAPISNTIDTGFKIVDSTLLKTDTIKATLQAPPLSLANKLKCDSCAINKAILYLRSELSDKIEESQLIAIRQNMKALSTDETALFLAEKQIVIKDYFWFIGPMMYLEAMFWTIIGALCSIMFAVAMDMRNYPGKRNAKYYISKIPYDVAKLFYAPFGTVVLLLAYNYIRHRNVTEVNTTQGMIVFAYFVGLLSGRLMNALNNIKEMLLPDLSKPYKQYNDSKHYESKPLPVQDAYYDAPHYDEITEQPQTVQVPKPEVQEERKIHQQNKNETPEKIKLVSLELKLDSKNLFEDETAAIIKHGLDKAMVTIHQVNGKNIFPLHCQHGTYVFNINDVAPGIYIVRSTLSILLNDGYMMNMFGEKTVFINHDNTKMELYIRKYEALD